MQHLSLLYLLLLPKQHECGGKEFTLRRSTWGISSYQVQFKKIRSLFIIRIFQLYIIFYWLFYLFTIQRLVPSWFPLHKSSTPSSLQLASIRVFSYPPTHPLPSHCPRIPLPWGIKTSQDQGLPLPLMLCKALPLPSSATYAGGAMGPSVCIFWLVVQSLGALGDLVSSYCCSSYGLPFSTHPFC